MYSKGKYTVKAIFYDVQFSESNHPTCKKVLTDIYKKSNVTEFLKELTTCLKVCLVHGEKSSPNVERTLDFAANFAVSFSSSLKDEETCPLLEGVFQYIFENHDCPIQLVRLRVCQLMNRLLDYMGQDATVIEETYNKIAECMLIRLKDSMTSVRTQAVYALHRLQTPTDPKCDIIQAFMFHMTHDPCHDVRRAVVQKIAVNKSTLASILTRMNDVKDLVRKEAYSIISRFLIRQFTIKQRQLILENGLSDRSEAVRDYVIGTLVSNWLKYFNHNYYDFLECIHVEKIPDTGIKLLKALFEKQHDVILESRVKELGLVNRVVPHDKLNVITVVYWRAMAEHCRPSDDSDKLEHVFEQIMPDLTPFCNYIREYFFPPKTKDVPQEDNNTAEENDLHSPVRDGESSQEQNMETNTAYTSGDRNEESRTNQDGKNVQEPDEAALVHLLEMCKVYDLADEMGRSSLRQLCVDFLQSPCVTLVSLPVLASLLDHTVPCPATKLSLMAEIISELREPLLAAEAIVYVPDLLLQEAEDKKAEIGEKITELETEYEIAEDLEDIARAEEIKAMKQNLEEELKIMNAVTPNEPGRNTNDDPETLKKCLTIVVEIMKKGKILKMDSTLYSLMQNFIIPILDIKKTGEGAAVYKNLALEALGIFCLLDGELAKEHFLTFCFNIANETLSVTALKCMFDMLHLYGLDNFISEDPESVNNSEQASEEGGPKKHNMIVLLMSLLSSDRAEMRRVAVIGLCKMLFFGRIKSPELVSKLIVLWYNPAVENDPYIRQPLGVFFPAFSSGGLHAPDLLVRSFLPTMKTFFKLEVTDPLAEVDVEKVATLIIELTRPNYNKHEKKDYSSHNQIAIKICEEILTEELESLSCIVLVKTLNQLDLNFNIPVDISILTALTARMIKSTPKEDKALTRLITKFDTMLQVRQETNKTVSTVNNTVSSTRTTSLLLMSQDSGSEEEGEPEEEEELSQEETVSHTHHSSQDIVIPGTPETSDDESESVFKGFTSDSVFKGFPPQEKRTVSPDSDEDFKGFVPVKVPRMSGESRFKRPSSPTNTRTPFKMPAKTPKNPAKTPGKKGSKGNSSCDTSSSKSTNTKPKTPVKTPGKTLTKSTRASDKTTANKNSSKSPARKTPLKKKSGSPGKRAARNRMSSESPEENIQVHKMTQESPGRKSRLDKSIESDEQTSEDSKIHANKKLLQSPGKKTVVNKIDESPEKKIPRNRKTSESPQKKTQAGIIHQESPGRKLRLNKSVESEKRAVEVTEVPTNKKSPQKNLNKTDEASPEKIVSLNKKSLTQENVTAQKSPGRKSRSNMTVELQKRTSEGKNSMESPEKKAKSENNAANQQQITEVKSPNASPEKKKNWVSPRRKDQVSQNVAGRTEKCISRNKEPTINLENKIKINPLEKRPESERFVMTESPGRTTRSSQSSAESQSYSSPGVNTSGETLHESTTNTTLGIQKLGKSTKKKIGNQNKRTSKENSENESPEKRTTRSTTHDIESQQNSPAKRPSQSPEKYKSGRNPKGSSQSSTSTDREENSDSSPDYFKPVRNTRSTRKQQ